MAIISLKHSFLYLLAPGTGSTSIGDALINAQLGTWLPEKDIVDHNGNTLIDSKHCTIPQLKKFGLINDDSLKSMVKFTSVRNPFDYWVSEWARSRRWAETILKDPKSWIHKQPGREIPIIQAREMEFSDWIKLRLKGLFEKGVIRHLHKEWIWGTDQVIRQEYLKDDFKRIMKLCGIDSPPIIPHLNKGPLGRKNYRQYYDSHAKKMLIQIYANDLNVFNYEF